MFSVEFSKFAVASISIDYQCFLFYCQKQYELFWNDISWNFHYISPFPASEFSVKLPIKFNENISTIYQRILRSHKTEKKTLSFPT